jgi:excisionase family DNA binding protein
MKVREKLLTVAEVASILGVPRPRMYILLRSNIVPGRVQVGRQIRVNPAVFRTFLEGGGKGLDGGSQASSESARS